MHGPAVFIKSVTMFFARELISVSLSSFLNIRKERLKMGTIDEFNLLYVNKMNGMDILLGRTIVVSCEK
jgi:hypothetical protein